MHFLGSFEDFLPELYLGISITIHLNYLSKKYAECPEKLFYSNHFSVCHPCLSTGYKEIFIKKREKKKLIFFLSIKGVEGLR